MAKVNLTVICLAVATLVSKVLTTEVLRPRGVPLSKKIFYDPSRDFSCLDGSSIVPFNFVNDDYCDCSDGSDEPGTAACTDGVFYCTNAGYIPQYIPSSRVNDGICDCCDASDEFNSTAECISNCRELGQSAREEAERQAELYKKGYEYRQDLMKKGKQKKDEFKSKLEELKSQENAAQQDKELKEVAKREAEEKEKVVLDKYKDLEELSLKEQDMEEAEKRHHEEKDNAMNAFNELDTNGDGVLHYSELQSVTVFDSNRDGVVSEEEAKFFLHMKDEMDLEEFITTGWMIMKPIYMMSKINTQAGSSDDIDEISETDEDYHPDEVMRDNVDDEDEEIDEPPKFPPTEDGILPPRKEKKIRKVEYDPESQVIIDETKRARDEYVESDNNLRKLKDDIKDLEESMETDFGPEEEFATLKDQCFDYTEREYTYKFCPFERAAQVPKSGGGEVSLGRGGKWAGPEGNKYSEMLLEGGMVCWNGPARTVRIMLQCGLENKLISSSEPNRCEYQFGFTTPALCTTPPSELDEAVHNQMHEEL